jgi:ribosomal protein L37AE/L43A
MVFNCNVCDSRFGSNGNLNRHIEACHESKIWKCDVCQDVFNAKSFLDKHKKIKHSIKKMSKHLTTKFMKD